MDLLPKSTAQAKDTCLMAEKLLLRQRDRVLTFPHCASGSEDGGEAAGVAGGETSALLATQESPSRRGEATKEGAKVSEESLRQTEIYYSSVADSYLFIYLSVLIDSDITTLTSASYQSSLPLHGQHLLSLQGEI